ncbi:putative DMBT1-like protein [Stegostoma tigrinum]|uniref:putative DMBT1-like protein n=1 Tax=Stegostoma tigrinum TaxID=3053191 RepID=UPI00286FB67A|nr:putative DMBT1-like protein [Stegostoma tigrinum]
MTRFEQQCPIPIRLVNGTSVCSGRVEVYHNSVWGTVCDDGWDSNAADVVCRVLNCGTAQSAQTGAFYGEGTGNIWIHGVKCLGTEPTLDQCSASPQGMKNCTHSQDAGVTCTGPVPVRLVNGTNLCSGRVEVYRNSVWGTICDNGWNVITANVVCRMLNCGMAQSAHTGAYYGEGNGDIWFDDVSCNGTETALDQCSVNPRAAINCTHRKDTGVTCSVSFRLASQPKQAEVSYIVSYQYQLSAQCLTLSSETEDCARARFRNLNSVIQPGTFQS